MSIKGMTGAKYFALSSLQRCNSTCSASWSLEEGSITPLIQRPGSACFLHNRLSFPIPQCTSFQNQSACMTTWLSFFIARISTTEVELSIKVPFLPFWSLWWSMQVTYATVSNNIGAIIRASCRRTHSVKLHDYILHVVNCTATKSDLER